MVGQRPLEPLIVVRIHVGEPLYCSITYVILRTNIVQFRNIVIGMPMI